MTPLCVYEALNDAYIGEAHEHHHRRQRLTLLLNELRLPAIKHLWQQFAERSDKEGWTAARFLMALAEHEIAERDRRRIERHLGEAKLPQTRSSITSTLPRCQ